MNSKRLACLLALPLLFAGLAACQPEQAQSAAETGLTETAGSNATVTPETGPLESGIDSTGMDESVRPQDDLFAHVNGKWVADTEIPADKARWGTFDILRDQSREDIRTLIMEVSQAQDAESGSPTQKIRDFYNSYLDWDAVSATGLEAIRPELDAIAGAESLDDIYRLWAELRVYGVDSPIGGFIFSDMQDPNVIVVYIAQSGLTLPDRDYYLLDDEQFVKGRQLYLDYVTRMFEMMGEANASDRAEAQLAFEKQLAEVMWTKEENRDWTKRYNPHSTEQLLELAPRINWKLYLETAQVADRDMYLVSQPSFFAAADDIVADTDLDILRDYLTVQTVANFAEVMGEDWFTLNFEFFDRGLRGVEAPEELWKRAITSINGNMGELLGQLYVEKHFKPEAKARMNEMIDNLIAAYEASIKELDWMSDATRQQALDKLHKFTPKIGYPDKWIDYSALEVVEHDLMTNIKNGAVFAYNREIDKLDKPVDKTEWGMTPQTVNAYYNPVWNEIVFPASILQPPFFNVEADDAVNYGGIGAVIGHEIGHGFDDSGKRFDGDGILRDWWTEEDAQAFDARKNALAAQYDGYEVIDGLTINGQFTSGENIGDLGGLAIAHKAYRMSLGDEEAPVIDGWTGDQRFFLGWAQVWRAKARPEEAKRLLTVDSHSPPKFRANGAVVNVPAFYEAFGVTEGDGMYLPAEERIKIW